MAMLSERPGSRVLDWDSLKGPKDPSVRVPLPGSTRGLEDFTVGFQGPKTPIIRYSDLGQFFCRLLFWRVYEN